MQRGIWARQQALRKLRQLTVLLVVLSLFLFFGAGFLAFVFFITQDFNPLFWFLLAAALLGFGLLIFAVRTLDPRKSTFLKQNPALLDQIQEAYDNTVYEDDLVVCSEKHIVSKKNVIKAAAFADILAMYVDETRAEGLVPVHRELVLVTKQGDVRMSWFSKSKLDSVCQTILVYNPNVKEALEPEEWKAIRQTQKEYREYQKNWNN